MRERTVCMMRVRNEQRFIRRSLERTFEVCKTVVLWDDGSTDRTEDEALLTLGNRPTFEDSARFSGWIARAKEGNKELHFLHSPFTADVRQPSVRVNEIRDKRALWNYVQTATDADTFLCMDGDENLSRRAVREWSAVHAELDQGVDMVHLSFVYIWEVKADGSLLQRYDGIYGPSKDTINLRTLNFPRVFTTRRVSPDDFFMMTFAWVGSHSFHCGSIPRQSFLVGPDRCEPCSQALPLPVVHLGYVDENLRQGKYEFYNRIDKDNIFEGRYLHIIGEPDQHAPGPVQLAPYEDL